MKKLVSFLLALILLLSLTACASSGAADAPPVFRDLESVLYLPKEEALQKLNLAEADLTENSWTYYDAGRKQKICGVDFDYEIEIAPINDVERLTRVNYMVILDDPKQAVDTVLAIATAINKSGATAVTPKATNQTERITDFTPEKLEEKVKAGEANITDDWILGEMTTEGAKVYKEDAAQHQTYGKFVDPTTPLDVMVSLQIIQLADTKQVVIFLKYYPEIFDSQFY